MRFSALAALPIVLLLSVACGSKKEETPLPPLPDQVTWAEHIAPIVYKECSPCHRDGEAGSFPIENYEQARRKGALIRFATQSGYMPPWPADPAYSHFIGERVLTALEKALIKKWVDSGMTRGDSLQEPVYPKFHKGSFFGKPDLVIHSSEAVKISGNGQDAFLIWKFPYNIEKDTLVDLVEFVPHRRKLVHHVNGHLVSYDANRKFNYTSGKAVHADTKTELLKVYADMHIPYTDGKEPQYPTLTPNAVYYLPGYLPPRYPDDVGGYRLKKNGLFLLNNIHYGPSNAELWDSSCINVFFRKRPLQRTLIERQLGTFGITPVEPELRIAPEEIKTFHTQYTLPQSISLVSVNPHMHLIGKTFWAFALEADGDTIPLIRINKWDFRWQYYYTYKHPVKLERGTVIHVYGTYDNTAQNPNNPNHPPKEINEGNGIESMKTSEEMFQFIFTYMTYKNGDEKIDLERKTEKTKQPH